ncbi:hypothetical protein [Streptomyces lunaelactis]|uniref:hypothetical protein n=1 Tax=Streptomyces lunaelactis TaxID=1535768 RepID=UPI001585CB57|nr:hypothetical protein [Streptomyces lunaelactis]NUK03232.1 hypothetical protein [Streptomyces lunaelactis]NUK18210.1 hypothetical protein [Streptomyces lunaelactis]
MPVLAVLLVLAFTGVRQVDAALGRIEVPGHPSATMSDLFTWTPSDDTTRQSSQAWCVWFKGVKEQRPKQGTAEHPGPAALVDGCLEELGKPDKEPLGTPKSAADTRWLLRGYAALDTTFVILYVLLLARAVKVMRRRLNAVPQGAGWRNRAAAAAKGGPLKSGWLVWVPAVLLVLAEVTETVCQLVLANVSLKADTVNDLARSMAFATLVKWVATAVLALVLVALVAVAFTEQGRQWWRGLLRGLRVLRLQLAVAVLLLLLLTGLGTDQVQDALLGLLDTGWRTGGTLVAMTVLSLLLWRSVHRTLPPDNPRLADTQPWFYRRPPVYSVVVVGAILTTAGVRNWFPNLGGLGVVLLVVAALTWLAGNTPARARTSAPDQDQWNKTMLAWARLLAALPLLVVGVFAVRAAMATALVGPEAGRAQWLLVLGSGLALLALLWPALLGAADARTEIERPGQRLMWLYPVLAGLCVVVLFASVIHPLGLPVVIGPLATATFFLSLLLVVLNELQRWSERATPMACFSLLRLAHTPVFVLLAVWFFIGAQFDTEGHNAVRVRETKQKVNEGVTPKQALAQWAKANCALAGPRDKTPVRLVIVSASGGGIRAAYWTGAVLDRFFPPAAFPGPPHGTVPAEGDTAQGGDVPGGDGGLCHVSDGRTPVFAVSGVSGGSLGAVAWLSRTRTPAESPHKDAATSRAQLANSGGWYQDVFGADHLSAAVAWMLYVDIPREFIGFGGKDRAAVLEESWEDKQSKLGDLFYSTWQNTASSWTPLALLNGTAVESGCRVLTSPLEAGAFDRPIGSTSCVRRPEDAQPSDIELPGSPTLVDLREGFLCEKQDINRSTAALLSARFPYITPSGRLSACGEHSHGKGKQNDHLSVVDGGYIESTASLTAFDLHRLVKPLIDCHNLAYSKKRTQQECPAQGIPTRPIEEVFVQIDNGYDSVAATGPRPRPNELFVPPMGQRAVAATSGATARQRTFESIGCARYLRFANVRGPGTQAPLGWVMSDSAEADLDEQLNKLPQKPGTAAKAYTILKEQLDSAHARCVNQDIPPAGKP